VDLAIISHLMVPIVGVRIQFIYIYFCLFFLKQLNLIKKTRGP
jgi:phosphotransferase system  glucose/maltose/N-acetylglucosamine-specific IIC component